MLTLKRPFIWLKRIRKRCGYGVHSPSAFDFITNVIYEKANYYAYHEIESSAQYHDIQALQGRRIKTRVNRLLFRLVNRFQPDAVIEVGPLSTSVLYLRAAKKDVEYFSFSTATDEADIITKEITQKRVNFVFVRYGENSEILKNIVAQSFSSITRGSIFVIEGICYNSSMKQLWKEIELIEYAVITYDLYDLGIVVFDPDKIKQHYKVNF